MPTILIVDDEPDVLMLMRVIFQGEGFQVRQAADGREALEQVSAGGVDVVVTDLMMPRMDGNELIRHLRDDEQTAGLPIIVVSARSGRVDGADAVFTKPFSSDDLVGACRDLLAGRDA